MEELFNLANLGNLMMLIFLQAVLGFDNLLYITIESQRAPKEKQAAVRRWGIIIAVALRIVLLFTMIQLIERLQAPFFSINIPGVIEGEFNFAVIVFLFGGVFIMYTAVKEISHMLSIDDLVHEAHRDRAGKSAWQVVALIVMMNLIFSFDSILSALAITDVFILLAIAIILSGIAMLVLADRVAEFLQKNRMYEVLGLFILLIVGVVLLGEGGHQGHLKLAGFAVEPLSKTTFYFSVIVLVLVEVVQSGYQRKLAAEKRLGAIGKE
ncbi:TerC family protein [Oceanomicrobium pacificus]|uniref:Tellurium resistance protein TerC n=1 Tax=Oceanomicrobium pacificus TaxID=2692916 RepID=A0A6B0TUE9_9RHOB|nr:TerC family protein [Oceanomicrobium pacificus]MXU65405.1 tellurium resistance protein TerC [Oceanomicrobium pacificus]